jgi:hypothetical protein
VSERTSAPLSALILQKVSIIFFCKSQFPHKFVDSSFMIANAKNRLTGLCGNRLLPNDVINTLCEISSTSSSEQHPGDCKRRFPLQNKLCDFSFHLFAPFRTNCLGPYHWFRGGLVVRAHRLCPSTLGWRVMKKKKVVATPHQTKLVHFWYQIVHFWYLRVHLWYRNSSLLVSKQFTCGIW